MNHEHDSQERLPTAESLFHRAGEAAVLTGHIEEIDTEAEQFRQFVVQKFSSRVKREWPTLRKLSFIPSHLVDGIPSDDAVAITLDDTYVRQEFVISRSSVDECAISVEKDDTDVYAIPGMRSDSSQTTPVEDVTKTAYDTTPSASDIAMLDQIITTVSHYNTSA